MITKLIQKSLFIISLLFFALPAFAVEQVDLFSVEIIINQDSTLSITEIINYNFDDLKRHGIYRDIPIKYIARGGNYNLKISNIAVTNANNRNWNFNAEKSGPNLHIKIGNPNTYVTGKQTYIISYTIARAINSFENHQELYWNVVGDSWTVPINQSEVRVYTPDGVKLSQATCYSGEAGTKDSCDTTASIDDFGNLQILLNDNPYLGNKLFFAENDTLSIGEVFTIVIGMPVNTLTLPTIRQNIVWILFDNKIIFLPFIVFLLFYYHWLIYGKDPEGKIAIMPRYTPPKGLTPAEIGTLIDEKVGNRDISATIIDLAIQGYVTIEQIESTSLFGKDDYELTKIREPDALTTDFEMRLLHGIFGIVKKRKISDLKNSFYTKIPPIKKSIYASLVHKKFFHVSPDKVRKKYFGFNIVIIFIVFFIGALAEYTPSVYELLSLLATIGIIFGFGFVMPKRTYQGVLIQEHIKGFKDYLETAEKDRIVFHNAPERTPELFQKFLPFAMVLGVEKAWASQFKGIYLVPPSWYTGNNLTNSNDMSENMSNFSSFTNSAMTSHPSSASSGGSGFSGGGGGGGGGFGGGGGGSW